MRLSKHALTVLNAQYRSVLKKCLLINAGVFAFVGQAMADTYTPISGQEIVVNDNQTTSIESTWSGNTSSQGDGIFSYIPSISIGSGASLSLTQSRVLVGTKDTNNGKLSVNGTENSKSSVSLTNSSLDFSDGDGYDADVKMNYTDLKLVDSEMPVDGNLELKNSTFDISYAQNTNTDYQVEVYDLTLDATKVILDDNREQDTTLAAKNNLNIINGSEVNLSNNAVLAWNGQVYEDDGKGNDVCVAVNGEVNIKDSTLTLKDNSKLSIGMDDDEGADNNQAKLNISNSKIELKGSSSIEFYEFNKGNTSIEDSTISMNGGTSMLLNDLNLTNTQINMVGNSSITLNQLSLKDSSISTKGNANVTPSTTFALRAFSPFAAARETGLTEANFNGTEMIGSEKDNFDFDYANISIIDSDLETKGNLSITNSKLNFTCTGNDCAPEEDGPGIGLLGTNVTISNSDIVLGNKEAILEDYAYIGANKNFSIENSDITLNKNAILAYEGDLADGDGLFSIKGSNIILNDEAALNIGEKDITSKAPLKISDSEIELNGNSSIQFLGNNKENTTVKDSKITLNDESSMHLNDLALNDSTITITSENAKLEVTDVQLNNSAILGQNNVVTFKGDVEFSGLFDPAKAIVDGNVLTRKLADGGYDDDIAWTITKGTLKYDDDKILYEEGKHKLNSINFNGGTLDLVNGKASEIKLASLKLSETSNIKLDVDLAKEEMDRFVDTPVEGKATLNISKLNLVSDAKKETTEIEFTNNDKLKNAVNYENGKIQGYSPIYSYDVEYNDGNFTFTRGTGASSGDYNPSVYAGSVVGQTLATIQSTIAQTAFSSLNNILPQKDNAWVSVIGFDDTVDMKSFNNVDSEMYSVVGGVNSDVKHFNDFEATYGLYAGYINSEQKYDGNKINQNGGYIGLDSVLNKGNAELLASVNTGYIRNEDKHSFGNDKFDTYFTGIAAKAGYTYSLDNGLSVIPSLYAGYTFVNNEDYTSKSGVKIKNDNLHLFEVAPGVKVNKDFNNGWTGYAQAKYAFIMDNGGDADVNNINLPNISAKDYVEYGLGANKALNDSWSLSAEINRRDGGREGWNGNLNIKYNF
ncbi:MAG: autotransporter domain-containing protein [Muribaculaceae bacterium]|nr:autotransporter domain-containing protein [Muribaculaceae bacterium]